MCYDYKLWLTTISCPNTMNPTPNGLDIWYPVCLRPCCHLATLPVPAAKTTVTTQDKLYITVFPLQFFQSKPSRTPYWRSPHHVVSNNRCCRQWPYRQMRQYCSSVIYKENRVPWTHEHHSTRYHFTLIDTRTYSSATYLPTASSVFFVVDVSSSRRWWRRRDVTKSRLSNDNHWFHYHEGDILIYRFVSKKIRSVAHNDKKHFVLMFGELDTERWWLLQLFGDRTPDLLRTLW